MRPARSRLTISFGSSEQCENMSPLCYVNRVTAARLFRFSRRVHAFSKRSREALVLLSFEAVSTLRFVSKKSRANEKNVLERKNLCDRVFFLESRRNANIISDS